MTQEAGEHRARLGLTLAAAGGQKGTEIPVAMARESDRWLAYVRGLCLRYQIDPNPILDGVR